MCLILYKSSHSEVQSKQGELSFSQIRQGASLKDERKPTVGTLCRWSQPTYYRWLGKHFGSTQMVDGPAAIQSPFPHIKTNNGQSDTQMVGKRDLHQQRKASFLTSGLINKIKQSWIMNENQAAGKSIN